MIACAGLVASGLAVATPANAALTAPAKQVPVISAPDMFSAQAAARAQGSKVLVDNLTTETEQVWALPDGSLSSELSMGQARVRQRDGKWSDVDLSLKSGPNGITSVMPAVPVTYGAAGQSTIASMAVNGQPVSVAWGAGLPEPVLDGTIATYPDVRPGVDLVVQALRSGFEVSFSVKTAPSSPLSLPLAVTLPAGGDASMTSDGGLSITDVSGKPLVRGGSPVMFGAEKDPRTNQPKSVSDRLCVSSVPDSEVAGACRSLGEERT